MTIPTMHFARLVPLFTCTLLVVMGSPLWAKTKIASPFSDNMVLQREKPVPVWGWSDPGGAVTVTFAGQKHATKADAQGKWMVRLQPLKASAEPAELTVVGSE